MSQYQNNLELFRYLCLSDAKTEYLNSIPKCNSSNSVMSLVNRHKDL